MIGEFRLVRTYSAGVHMGVVKECNQMCVLLTDARRLFRWSGAFTLNEIAVNGVGEDSRISQPVEEILLTQAIEIIKCTPEAIANLTRSRNG
jgi:hypothetical protein